MQLSVLIISYNTRELSLACLRSLFAQTREASFQVIVVDNVSADGSADAVAGEFPQVRLIRSPKNLGFAAGNNLAAREAAGEWLLLLNPDTVVLDRAIDRLLAFAESHPETSIFGGRTIFADGSLNAASCWRRPTPWSAWCIALALSRLFRGSAFLNAEAYGGWPRDSVREVDIVSGCFLLIRRSLWEELGGFAPAFFMYGEEADLCLRARKLGHKCLVCPDATIIHYGGASEKLRADKMIRLFKAKAQLFARHWSPGSARFGVATLDLWALTRMAGFGIAALMRRKHRASFKTWQEVWRGRDAWHILGRALPQGAPAAEGLMRP